MQYEANDDNERSTAAGLMRTCGLITSAAFILVVVVGSFVFTDIEIIKALGLGLALAILIDATIIRIAVVPALMKLLGRANWWASAECARFGLLLYNRSRLPDLTVIKAKNKLLPLW